MFYPTTPTESPASNLLTGVWSYLQGALLRRYAEENNGVNVLTGPIFDSNYDGLRDPTQTIREYVAVRSFTRWFRDTW